jgi:Recombination endonuclease VII
MIAAHEIDHKKCTKCGALKPADLKHFYKHVASPSQLTPRCKPCVNEDNVAGYKSRLARDPDRVKAQARVRALRHYRRDIDLSRARMRVSAAKARRDPEKRAKINMRKRGSGAGLTLEQWNAIFEAQSNCCAICLSPDPKTRNGWNTDHCHRSGRVRFILCGNCNRGLGAFEDRPELLRRAADMLETIDGEKP